MKYFQKIPKDWKPQGQKTGCERCNATIDSSSDHFTVQAYWKIKDKADTYTFCSLTCLGKWAREDSMEQA